MFKLYSLSTDILQFPIDLTLLVTTTLSKQQKAFTLNGTGWHRYMPRIISQSMNKSINILAKQNKTGRKC